MGFDLEQHLLQLSHNALHFHISFLLSISPPFPFSLFSFFLRLVNILSQDHLFRRRLFLVSFSPPLSPSQIYHSPWLTFVDSYRKTDIHLISPIKYPHQRKHLSYSPSMNNFPM